MQCKFIGKFKYEMQLLKCNKYARDRKLTFVIDSRLFFLEWECFLLFHLRGLVRIRGWRIWGRIFLFTSSFSILLLDRLLQFFNRLWFLHLDSLRMLLLFLFLIKEGCPEEKANVSFFLAKWNWICPEATYMQAFAVLRKGRPRIKGVSLSFPCLRS
jgi:hypothetical protein